MQFRTALFLAITLAWKTAMLGAATEPASFSFTRQPNGIQLHVGETVKNVTFYGPDIVRVNASLGRSYTTQPSLVVVLAPPAVPLQLKDSAATLEVSSTSLRVIADKKTGTLTFLRSDGTVITRERADRPSELRQVTISDAPTYEVKQTFTLAPDESLYGLGQYNDRYMDYRGQKVLMVQTNIGIVVPLLLSTRRYGILWDIYSKSTFEDNASGASFWAESAPAGVDYYLVAGDTMDGVIAGYRQLTGSAPMFPKSAFGLWMSKERYKTQNELIDVVKRFRSEGIPLDNIVQDWQYWGGDKDGTWSGMIWNKERFPDPLALTNTLHNELHVKLMNSIWPSVGNDTELARELDAKGLRFAPLHWISKKARIYDAFSAEGRAIYFKHIKKGLLDVGVDALWMDGTEVEVDSACHDPRKVEADIKSLGKNALGDFTRYLNPYSLETTRGTYEGQRASSDKRVFTLTRSAWAGQQRYAALPWSGDTRASWQELHNQIAGGLNVSMAGLPYWTQDTGGFFIPSQWRDRGKDADAYRELFARWLQFAAFNPIYRIHGTDITRELYTFKNDPDIYRSLIATNDLRYRLIPYLYALGWQSTRAGYTMMRGLAMDFPDQTELRKIDDAYMFGPAFLVHPVTKPIYRLGTPPPPTIPENVLTTPSGKPGLAVEYFEGRNFEKSAGTSVDAKADYTWPGPPLAEPPAGLKSCDNFSARWTGFITAPDAGDYEIGAEADDGVRLWLDGQLVVDDWSTHPMRYSGSKRTLSAGQQVAVKIDYFNGTGARGLRLAWKPPGQSTETATINNLVETRLPAGSDWYDFWSNERLAGGRTVAKACPLDVFPLYVRAGSIVPMSPVMQYVTEKTDAPYEIRVYPGTDATFTLYEDDNETYAYERGQHSTVTLTWNDAQRTLTVGNREGVFPGMVNPRTLRIVWMSPNHGAGIASPEKTDAEIRYVGKQVKITAPAF
jgi:alpha-D-xyloside xylohydrolase